LEWRTHPEPITINLLRGLIHKVGVQLFSWTIGWSVKALLEKSTFGAK
jgi:hypothetical protein